MVFVVLFRFMRFIGILPIVLNMLSSYDGILDEGEQKLSSSSIRRRKGKAFPFWTMKLIERIKPTDPIGDGFFLDGLEARITPTEDGGYDFISGRIPSVDSGHAVLWTKKEYSGDVEIEFDYTRLDDKDERSVTACLLYFHAEGNGDGPYDRDISKWNLLRTVPAMNLYFGHMRLYHISFAAFDSRFEPHAYVRGRIYKAGELEGTNLSPDYLPGDFFQAGLKYHIRAGVKGRELYFQAERDGRILDCSWEIPEEDRRSHGRIGIRQMSSRSMHIDNITIRTEG